MKNYNYTVDNKYQINILLVLWIMFAPTIYKIQTFLNNLAMNIKMIHILNKKRNFTFTLFKNTSNNNNPI